MFAADVKLGYTFLAGVMATVNPCGFVLLPTYLMYFLGMEGARPGSQRAAISRALVVAGSVAGGFLAVFLLIGILYHAGVSWLLDNSYWFSLVIGIGMIVLGIAMLFGFHLALGTPKLGVGGKDRTVTSMFLYGISYAVASLGCTLPLFITVLGSVSRNGVGAGILNTLGYAVGMSVTLAGLTVALATARTGLLTVMRRVMQHLDMVAGAFLVLTGVYLTWYSWTSISDTRSGVVSEAEHLNARLQYWVHDIGAGWLFVVLGGITGAAIVVSLVRRGRSGDGPDHPADQSPPSSLTPSA